MKSIAVTFAALLLSVLFFAGIHAQPPPGRHSGRGRNTGDITNSFQMEINMDSGCRQGRDCGTINYDTSPRTRGSIEWVSTGCNWTPSGASSITRYPCTGSRHSPGIPGSNSNGNCFIFRENINATSSAFRRNHFALSQQRDGSWWYLWIYTDSSRYVGCATAEATLTLSGQSSCPDNTSFRDENGYGCRDWVGYDCSRTYNGNTLSTNGRLDLKENCRQTCNRQTDDSSFVDENGYGCRDWAGYDCSRTYNGNTLTSTGRRQLNVFCPQTCGHC